MRMNQLHAALVPVIEHRAKFPYSSLTATAGASPVPVMDVEPAVPQPAPLVVSPNS
jgi:hypothetical protein